jgi:iron complex transport system permease protein
MKIQANRYGLFCAGMGLILLISFLLSLIIGEYPLSALWSLDVKEQDTFIFIMKECRFPRTLLGLLVGASLGMSGACLQGFLKNPLADAHLLGISSSCALGAVISMYTGLSVFSFWFLPGLAIIGGFGAVLFLMCILKKTGSPLTLILAGVGLSSLTGGVVALILNLSHNPYALMEIVFWLLGSFEDRTLEHVVYLIPFVSVGLVLLYKTGPFLNALSLGEEVASSLGYSLPKMAIQIVLGTALSVGAGVSISGMIGFIGLLVPHILRPFVGNLPQRLLIPSALGGALFALWADMGVRLLPVGVDLKIGVITAILGAPFFLWLILRNRYDHF